NVVKLETDAFDVIFNGAPEDGLHPFEFPGKQANLEIGVEVFRDDLRVVVDLEDDLFAVADDRHAIIALFGQTQDQAAITVRDVGDFETGAGEFQDPALDDAEGAPGELN